MQLGAACNSNKAFVAIAPLPPHTNYCLLTMSRPTSAASFDYDTLGDIPLFYTPALPPPAVIAEPGHSRWSVDTADLMEVQRETLQVLQRVDLFLRPRAWCSPIHDISPSPTPLPSPVVLESRTQPLVRRLWIRAWSLFCRIRSVWSL